MMAEEITMTHDDATPPERSALPQLVAAACQVRGHGGIAGQIDGLVVRSARISAAVQPAQQVGTRGMEGVIPVQFRFEAIHDRECRFWPVEFGDRDGPVEGDDR
jgi:hypothetical protein